MQISIKATDRRFVAVATFDGLRCRQRHSHARIFGRHTTQTQLLTVDTGLHLRRNQTVVALNLFRCFDFEASNGNKLVYDRSADVATRYSLSREAKDH
ncbi:UNVERIFIED_ORG: hypothetical protein [Salmonella phage PSP2-22]